MRFSKQLNSLSKRVSVELTLQEYGALKARTDQDGKTLDGFLRELIIPQIGTTLVSGQSNPPAKAATLRKSPTRHPWRPNAAE